MDKNEKVISILRYFLAEELLRNPERLGQIITKRFKGEKIEYRITTK